MDLLHPQVNDYLAKLSRHGDPVLERLEEEARAECFPIIGPAAGQFCYLAARMIGARRIFELGSGFGYSTLWFARAVRDAGIKFIGPSPESIELMGDKTNARVAAVKAGAPIVPGSTEPMANEVAARKFATWSGCEFTTLIIFLRTSFTSPTIGRSTRTFFLMEVGSTSI